MYRQFIHSVAFVN